MLNLKITVCDYEAGDVSGFLFMDLYSCMDAKKGANEGYNSKMQYIYS